ncbi:arabinan endo-1,5-alpha-L-arabinosidase [Gracilibacillus ureilyticus]|uniref:Arabinan endo-1,5-alpha-L-arabinosidase n=1 Tax=Gracilibacillus ureilyticus TaxID=531814 RepID=A0A1H9UFY2_9BACI|nr:family 43 glycosylhydrolase [Gracilibacillus ureilyticus]SES08178.1 arabinan endo-1,5-alpha-L-arabinosidase [Gracilibacillus ureilyticus]
MKKFLVFLAFLMVFAGGVNVSAATEEQPVFSNVSVHDPSVIRAEDTYYIFGSHLAAAKTEDLLNWTQIEGDGVTPENSLFNDVTVELEEALTWAQTETLWAPDVIQLKEDGKYYMYYNACEGSSPRSAMGIAVSDHPEGPYEDLGLILRSGMTLEESAVIDGTPYDEAHYPDVYDATVHPNVVDPDVFYDEDGKLWMVYGSYSGGIFILELDPETGFPVEGQGYGTKLLGGNHSRIEAPYMVYNEETDYYYLYLSYGGLDAVGGYNVRVARSKNPDGPYVDIQGNQMIDTKGAEGTVFDDESIAPTGTKLIGNHLFDTFFGEEGEAAGYVSPGHNSVYYDDETGEQFLIFHTRFPERGEQHEVRVHSIFMNKDGWPVVAPFRYTGETLTSINEEEVAGNYKFINFRSEITAELDHSVQIELREDGTITGDVTGSWQLSDDNYVTVQIGDNTYEGVAVQQWDPMSSSYTITFTAVGDNGLSIWGSQFEDIDYTDQEIVDIVTENLTLGDTSNITRNLFLPENGEEGTIISWESSDQDAVTNSGIISRPKYGEEAKVITLTATVTKGDATNSKTFEVTILPETFRGLTAHYQFEQDLTDTSKRADAGEVTGNIIGAEGGTITYEQGKSGFAAKFDGESGIRLDDGLITSDSYTVSFWLKPEVLTDYTTTFFGAKNSESWISFVPNGTDSDDNALLWSGTNWFDGVTNTPLAVNEWSHVAFSAEKGDLAIYINGELQNSLTGFPDVFTTLDGVFSLGVNYWDTPYKGLIDEVLVYNNMTLSDEEIQTYYETLRLPVDQSTLLAVLKEAKDKVTDHRYAYGLRKKLDRVVQKVERNIDEMSQSEVDQAVETVQNAIDNLKLLGKYK